MFTWIMRMPWARTIVLQLSVDILFCWSFDTASAGGVNPPVGHLSLTEKTRKTKLTFDTAPMALIIFSISPSVLSSCFRTPYTNRTSQSTTLASTPKERVYSAPMSTCSTATFTVAIWDERRGTLRKPCGEQPERNPPRGSRVIGYA